MIITGKYPNLRMRRSRKNSWSRRLVQENSLSYNDLILPIFLTDGSKKRISIKSMPNIYSCLLYTSPSPRDGLLSRMPSSA